ncbi:type II toxin-antitoxin system HicA family toxin [Ruminococcus gauvreauii]|uniref:Type II toxin-antitoxin system HicA family toxin n=1 Tax=Ruminococcus gauvreauii TaxID=438033 RepID=A0ABY5VJB4_9FIRM|nr:type II toxin-antitoxin system HicA family toxin [Ruminococcus gauvreauii]UWP60417.1 type II toxin-antitoxin system HicA family toxin [Ruminococcus gauvreauii]
MGFEPVSGIFQGSAYLRHFPRKPRIYCVYGWEIRRINGSHHFLQKDGKTEVVPIHGKDVPKGLLNTILKRTGLK